MVQWSGVCRPMQGTQVRSLVWEDSTCRRALKCMGRKRGEQTQDPVTRLTLGASQPRRGAVVPLENPNQGPQIQQNSLGLFKNHRDNRLEYWALLIWGQTQALR